MQNKSHPVPGPLAAVMIAELSRHVITHLLGAAGALPAPAVTAQKNWVVDIKAASTAPL